MEHYLVTIDGREYDISLEYRSEKYYVVINGKKREVSRFRLGETRSLLLIDGKSHEVDVRSNGYDNHKVVFMNGTEIPVEIEQYNLAQLRKTAGMSSKSAMAKRLTAAMPGLVVDVKVAAGEKVSKGQPLLVLEAMKMENIIKAQGDAVVKSVFVAAGMSVEKGDKLMEFE